MELFGNLYELSSGNQIDRISLSINARTLERHNRAVQDGFRTELFLECIHPNIELEYFFKTQPFISPKVPSVSVLNLIQIWADFRQEAQLCVSL
jgi:hypothetical protein